MALTLKEIISTAKATLNLGEYSNVVYEITLTAQSDADNQEGIKLDTLRLQAYANEALISQVYQTTFNRLAAGIHVLNGKPGARRRLAIESQPCFKVLASLSPELAKEVSDNVLEISLAPMRNEEE